MSTIEQVREAGALVLGLGTAVARRRVNAPRHAAAYGRRDCGKP